MKPITPVLLAGGIGSRLWPLSRRSYPKQFANLIGSSSLFQQAALRLCSRKKLKFLPHIILTNSDYRFIVTEQLLEVGLDPGPILIEPSIQNTGPAILAATLYAQEIDPDSVLFISPSDHIMSEVEKLHECICIGAEEVNRGNIVTFGISPTRAETGYGYLETSTIIERSALNVDSFIEKPQKKIAENMFKKSNFLWNSGMFMFRVKDMIKAFEHYCSNLIDPVSKSVKNGVKDLGFYRLQSKAWSNCENISIDFAIMEKATNVVAVPFSGTWSDLGSWESVWEQMDQDENGVALSSNAHSIRCSNSLLRSENENQEIVGLGLENIIAVAMPDAVLVANKDNSEDIRTIASSLENKNISQSEVFPKHHRPWGWFEQLSIGTRFQVKRIMVKSGAALSLQSHHHRSEHWVVVEGTAKVILEKNVQLLSEGESIYIPLGKKHRLENPGKVQMILIEVQTGIYLGEDDIVRYEDNYSRI